MTEESYHAWVNRDLAPHLHREAYLHVLRESGLAEQHAEALYDRVVDTGVLDAVSGHRRGPQRVAPAGIKTAVVSNIAFDLRPALALGAADYVDEYVLSFEIGAVKPDPAIFETALARLGVEAAHAVMVGDSEEADGGAPRWVAGSGWSTRCRRPATGRAENRANRIRRHVAVSRGPERIRLRGGSSQRTR